MFMQTLSFIEILEERLGMKKCRQKHGGFLAFSQATGICYLPLTNRVPSF